jgi:putative membrane protein
MSRLCCRFSVLVVLMIAGCWCFADAQAASSLSAADQKFVKEAAEGGMAEVELGRLAVEKASSDNVKKFGQRMVDDHSKANDKLKEIATSKGVTLPESPNAKQRATKARLEKLSGNEFDKAYMKDMLKDHKQDVADFQKESKTGKDSDVKNFASQTLPTLQDHLKNAESITPMVTQARSDLTTPKASQR